MTLKAGGVTKTLGTNAHAQAQALMLAPETPSETFTT